MELIYKSVDELIPYVNNPRNNDGAVDAVASSIKNFGFKVPIVVDKQNEIVNGHTRLKAAKKLGMEKVPCIIADDLSEEQVKAFRLADNKVAEIATWDFELLESELAELSDFDMSEFGFDISEFDSEDSQEVIEDDFEVELPEAPKTKYGDIYQLGNHKLMCGNSTKTEEVEKLMDGTLADVLLTDPPYNTGIKPKNNSGRLNHFFNDDFTDEEWKDLLTMFTKNAFDFLKENSVAYIFLDWRRNHELIIYLKRHFKLSNIIVWDKVVHGLGSDYKYTYELINVCKKGKPNLITNNGENDYQDIWHIQRKIGKDDDHATKKPIKLLERILNHTRDVGDKVLDLFGGSGSTLIACEQLNRICYMMELDPKYCDVIIKRWEEFTGQKAVKIN